MAACCLLAVGRCPESGQPLASQSTISRLENAPSKTEAARLTAALLDQFATTVTPGQLEILDIDDTFCAAHGGQQLAFWNAHHDERGFASMHIYHVTSGTPVATILRPARTPKGTEVRTVIKHVTKRLRTHWPNTRIVWRGDSHYGRVEAMEWAEDDGVDYIFGLAGNTTLDALVAKTADNLRFHHAKSSQPKLRTYASFIYQAGSWTRPRKVGIIGSLPVIPDTLTNEGLPSIHFVMVAASDHPLTAHKGKIPRELLAKHTQIVLTDRSDLSAGREMGVMSPTTWRLADLFAKHHFLLTGLGWGGMPLHVVQRDLDEGRLALLPIEEVPDGGLPLSMSAIWRTQSPPGPAGRWFIERLKVIPIVNREEGKRRPKSRRARSGTYPTAPIAWADG